MNETQDSSVLFALSELREQERNRAQQESEKNRERAEIARRQADAAARRRDEAKRNEEELLRLRELIVSETENRAELETQITQLRAYKNSSLVPAVMPIPESIPAVRAGCTHHLLWGSALLISCLGVFVLTYSPQLSPEPTEIPVPIVVAQTDCPEKATSQSPVPEKGTVARSDGSAKSPVRPKSPKGTKPRAPKTPKDPPKIIVTKDCNGPLCDLPD